jgi:hypothetical protein
MENPSLIETSSVLPDNHSANCPPEIIKLIVQTLVKKSHDFLRFRLVSSQFNQFILCETDLCVGGFKPLFSWIETADIDRDIGSIFVGLMNHQNPVSGYEITVPGHNIPLAALAASRDLALQIKEIYLEGYHVEHFPTILNHIQRLFPRDQFPKYNLNIDVYGTYKSHKEFVDRYLKFQDHRNEFDVQFNRIRLCGSSVSLDHPSTEQATLINKWLSQCCDSGFLKELQIYYRNIFVCLDQDVLQKLGCRLKKLEIFCIDKIKLSNLLSTIAQYFGGESSSKLECLLFSVCGNFDPFDFSKLSNLKRLVKLELKLSLDYDPFLNERKRFGPFTTIIPEAENIKH